MNAAREILRVLVVDDEGVLCQGVRRILEPFSFEVADVGADAAFEVKTVGSGEDCLRELEVRTPDILLLDYKLPGMTGLEVLTRIAPQAKGILVVMITAYASLETAVRATKLGAYDFLAKPFSPDELRYSMRKAATHAILSRRAKQLEAEKKQIRFEFLSVLAHELKAPLNAVEGYMDILRERTAGEELHMVERCVVRIGGMKKLIFDLLDLTRIESGLKKRELKATDLAPLLQSALEAAGAEAGRRGITLEAELGAPVILQADPGEMEIIFNNLVSNAVKYNREGGRVRVRLARSEDEVVLEVEDTGIGMSEEESRKLFREFVRIRNERTAKVSGSGLGLSTVKKLAKMYGGDVSVRSQPGMGSTFVVTLRDAAAPEAQDPQKTGGAYATNTGR
ncbi:MAG: hybrid sensor histidine kinase/response regulator [Elusimicrobiota bacterium]|jgi:signal transduction histidine kinase